MTIMTKCVIFDTKLHISEIKLILIDQIVYLELLYTFIIPILALMPLKSSSIASYC